MTGRRGGVHRLFEAGVLLKGIDGVLETAGGLLFLFVHEGTLYRIVDFVSAHELSAGGDLVVDALRRGLGHLSPGTKTFASVYLAGHGLIKIFLAAGLLRGKRWAYPTALAVLGAFVVYQVVRLAHTRSHALLALTVLDVVIIVLIWLDWRKAPPAG